VTEAGIIVGFILLLNSLEIFSLSLSVIDGNPGDNWLELSIGRLFV
jgi:hypothetical protein